MTPAVPIIIVRFCDVAAQWRAWFDQSTRVSYGADLPMTAVHLLLEGSGTAAGDLVIHEDQDQLGSWLTKWSATWQPPELLFRCLACHGKGKYVWIATVEKCRACGGKGWIAR